MRFEERAHKYEYKLNDTDDQIIEYIIKNKEAVVHSTIKKISSDLFTVPNTIMRLSKKLGYDGFSHMKNSIRTELEKGETPIENSTYQNIQKTFELIDEEVIRMSAKTIHDAKHVLFYAVGNSSDLCNTMVRCIFLNFSLAKYTT